MDQLTDVIFRQDPPHDNIRTQVQIHQEMFIRISSEWNGAKEVDIKRETCLSCSATLGQFIEE